MRSLAAALVAAAVGLALCLAATASASSSLRVGIFDDGMVLYGEPDAVFAQLSKTEAQLVRVNLWWAGPSLRVATARPRRPADPNDPAYNWDTYDRTVRFAVVNGMEPIFSIIGTPPWANAAKGWNVAPTNAAGPPELRGGGAEAVQRHVRQRRRGDASRVSLWMAWNEPNNPVFLKPQYRRVGHGLGDPVGARLREDLQRDRPGRQVRPAQLEGGVRRDRPAREQQPELEPPLRLAAAVPQGDEGGRREGVRRLRAPPVLRLAGRDADDQAAARQARAALDRGDARELRPAREGDRPALRPSQMRIWVTEYGYQTNPPDKIFGVTYRKQATYLTQAVAWARRNPRVDIFLWFLLTDEQRLGGWQSGLTTVDGKRKASFRAFQKAVEQYGT